MFSVPSLPSRAVLGMVALLFAFCALLVYGASLENGFVRWDDAMLIYQNPAVMELSLGSVRRAFTTYDPELYIPLTLLTYQFDFLLGDGTPFLFHFNNLVLHTVNALLVCWFLFLLFRNRFVALACGLLFLVHPLHTEAVAWASGRKDVLAAAFFLGATIAFLYARAVPERRRPLLSLSIGLFVLGLLSKVVVLTLPVVLVLLLVREKGGFTRRDAYSIVPYVFFSIAFGIVALYGKTDVNASSTLAQKLLVAAKSSVFYLEKLFWPANLTVVYPFPETISAFSPAFMIPIAVLLVLTGLVVWSLRFTREIAVWACAYLVTLAPTFINIAKGDEGDIYTASDRYAYIPSIAILCIAAYALARFLEADVSHRRSVARMRTFAGGASAAVVLLGALAALQSLTWKDSRTLFEHAVAHAPYPSHAAYNNLANAYRSAGEYDKAVEHFMLSLGVRPNVEAYVNLGAVYRKQGRFAEALKAYDDAIVLRSDDASAYFGKGIVFAAQGNDDEAFEMYNRALEIDPHASEVYTNIGALHMRRGDTELAIEAYRDAVREEPTFADPWYNLGVALAKLERFDEAIDAYGRAEDLNPRSIPTHINLGVLHARMGSVDEAIAAFRAILRIDPDNATATSALRQLGAGR